jgi:hypothetical protein
MAEKRTVRDVLTFRSKAAQCPSCFTFNHPEYLPEKKKKLQASGLQLTCAVCGTPYETAVPQAA